MALHNWAILSILLFIPIVGSLQIIEKIDHQMMFLKRFYLVTMAMHMIMIMAMRMTMIMATDTVTPALRSNGLRLPMRSLKKTQLLMRRA